MGQVLILKEDKSNPMPDRRKKRDGWAVPTWKAGSRWSQRESYFGDDSTPCIKPLNLGYASPKPWWIVEKDYGLTRDDFAVKEATTWQDISMEEGDWSGYAGEVLNVLIRREAVSVQEVREILRFIIEQPEEE